MSALRDAMSHAALGWVKPELDETLRQVRGEIESFVEDPADTSRMRFCAGYLHQVQGTLRMVELYAPAMVAEELELLAIAVQNGQVPDRDEACATLMRGTVLLPDYLERLQDGHRDIPIVLLPLLNEIRASRGEPGLSEGALFALSPDASAATEAELDHARGSLSGRNRELLDTVGTAIKEELLRVKDALDLHLRTGGDVAALQTQVDELGSVADTLGVMGLGVARGVVVQQRDALRSIVAGERQADEGLLLDIAGALLYVDASLDDQVAYLGASAGIHDDASAAEARRTVEVLAHEAIANFAAAREHFVAFIETNWEHERLSEVPRLLGEVAGALRMLELPQPADYLEGVRRYVATELIGKRRVPSGRQLDTLADAMASLEYYLEALRERRPGREEILDITRTSLETLRYWPLPSAVPAPQGVVPNGAADAALLAEPDAAPADGVAAAPSAVVAPPLAPSWDLAPVADAPIAASMPPPLPSQTPQAPQWTLHEDAAVMANAEAAERIDAAADPSAAAVSAAGNEAAFVVVSSPISFDPVAAEQEEGSALAEPLQITTDTLALEGDAFRTMHAAAAPATDEAAPANYGFDPVAAEYAERDADAGHDDPSLGIVDAQAAAPTDTAHDDVLVMELEDAPAFADTASDEVHTIVWNDTPVTLADDNDNDNDNDFAAEPNTPTIDLSLSDTVFVAAPESEPGQAPHAHAGEAEHADVDAGAEHSPFVDLTWPEPTPAPEARVPGVHQASIQPIALDPASAAFLAELDAAASQFDVTAAPAAADTPSATDAGEDVEAPAPVVATDGGFVDDGGDIDADIREVFLEEFDEELVNLGNLLPAWRAAPNQLESLRPIRRVFHTLKGSGRLVGARVLGEFSWKIESMLNRVLDGTRAASPAVVTMVELAYEVLPQLNAALRGHGVIHADLDAIQAVADRVAAGEDAYYFAAAPAVAGAAPRAGTPASVDSVLREILEAEVGTHLETVRDWLQHAPQPATEALLRAVHTMSGAFAMTDVPEITEVTGPAESYVKRLLAAAVVPGADGVRALDDAAQAIAATIEELQAPSPVIPPFTALAQRLQALVATLPDLQWSALAHEEDEEDHAERSHPQADAALDPQLLQAVELTAADDLSAYLGDARHLDAAGADAEHADAAHVAENADADASAAQASDAPPPPLADDAHMLVPSDAAADAATATPAPDGSGVAFDAEHASAGANLAQDDDAAEQASAPVAPPADSGSASAAIDPDTQALLAQDGKLDELTVDAPLADEGAPADSELPPPAEELLAAQQQDATAVDGTTHGEPHQDGDQEASQRDAHDQNEQDQARDSHGYALNAEPVPPSTQWHGSEPVSANDDAELLPVADDAAVHADTAPHAHDDAEAAAQSQHNAVDHDVAAHAAQTDIETHPADAAAVDAIDAHDHVTTPHAEDGAHAESESESADADADAALGATADFEQRHSTDTVDAPAHHAGHERDAGFDPTPAEAPSAHATPADETQASDIADVTPHNAEHPSDSAHPAHTDAEQPAHAQTDAPADTTSGDAQHAPADVADAPSFAESAPHAAAAADAIALAAVDLGPLDFADLDRELVDIFVEEGKDLLDHCDRLVAELRAAPQDRDALAGLQRDLHTLKGGARMAGVNPIGDLGHGIESLLEAVAANRTELDRRDVQLLERGFDRLHQLLTLTGNHRAVVMPDDLIGRFDARTHGRSLPLEAGTAAATQTDADGAATLQAAVAAESIPAAAPAPLSAPLPVDGTLDEESMIARPMQEQVRVRADLLDRLVNHAGEVAIYRSRLEQQLGAFRGAMSELDRTNARLRDQLRRLDLETEAQIVARYQREQDQTQQNFDPLELDRFSTLQQLSRALNESAADLGGLQGVLDDLARQYDGLLQQQSRVSSELQDGLMRARMVPFDGLVPRLRRVVRQAASETGKQVHLTLEGTHGELDRNVLDRMIAPLEHMLRNSVAHGLETPKQRRAAGKPEEGSIAIRLCREGSEIVLEVADDGAGLNRDAIRHRAEQRGLIASGAALSEEELDSLIFAPGFSTYDQVSQLAGRGVGMDVVRNEVRQLGGSVDIHSVWGQGVTFTLRLPQTLAVTQAVFVQIGETTFAVPVASVSGIGRISRERFDAADGGYHYSGEQFALHDLGSLVGQAPARAEGQMQVPLLLVRAGDLRAAVAIDQVLGNREIVVKPVGLQIASVPGIYGATITGDGRVVVILDVAPLVRRYLAQPARPVVEAAPTEQRRVPLVMVVDDSLTMRKVTSRVLERHNFDVIVARDGIEALERLDERVPDLMLLDIEMPRMDGYELATAMRADPRYRAVPIVMITSRSGEKHRQRAFEIGVQRYLGKPYQELDLMRNVYDLLGIARVRE
ncbi:Hpt domain-containing protein [Xanthomonas translucens]|uniref:Hpt domain-containing protein n=2 Tax=Xanthomonas campestris pv. translucens TaxID=343 RepID=UPI000642595C|nr:Hpt domain-containing protein [Xanthomonas translucens]AKK66891.1 transcriptional regulator [Xanthomonas translucens pv. undulosa]MCT8272321.1 Hpt domain-containing protein [Xanthomonas translucens pv. undulosa]WNJ30242.1 Hpt domain-containing protein [Xanthomonas translucens pv. undulosa]